MSEEEKIKILEKKIEDFNENWNIGTNEIFEDLKNEIYKAELFLEDDKGIKLLPPKKEQAIAILADCMDKMVDVLQKQELEIQEKGL